MWQKVCKLSEISEGSGKTLQCSGPVLALFNVGGKIYAMDNTCPHRGGPLGEGSVEDGLVTCPWHAWSFDVKTGECKTAPGTQQKTYPAKVESGDIFVDF